jgi:hypothetical protein
MPDGICRYYLGSGDWTLGERSLRNRPPAKHGLADATVLRKGRRDLCHQFLVCHSVDPVANEGPKLWVGIDARRNPRAVRAAVFGEGNGQV